MFGDVVVVLLKNTGPLPTPPTTPGEIPGVCTPNAAKLPITGVVVCIARGVCCWIGFICGILGFCTLRAFIEGAGAFDLFVLLASKLSKSIFKSPAFKLSDQVEPTWTAGLGVVPVTALEEAVPVDVCCCVLLLALTGCKRLLPALAIGGSILSERRVN